jgi:Uncharacterized conserved protein (DUF2190)
VSWSNQGLMKAYVASGAIPAYSAVKAGPTAGTVALATAATDKILGAVGELPVVDGERVDVILDGIADMRAGGTIAAGDLVTAAAGGAVVVAAAGNRIVGMALNAAVSGDRLPVFLNQGVA